jgi:hypothetical protein
VQLKRAIDPSVILRESRRIEAIYRAEGSNLPMHRLLYTISDSPYEFDLGLIPYLGNQPLFDIVAGALHSDEICLPLLQASDIRAVTPTQPDENGNFYGDLSAEPLHQDSMAHDPAILGDMVIVWLLLGPDKAGPGMAPSLRLIPGSGRELYEIDAASNHPKSGDIEISRAVTDGLIQEFGEWTPEIEIGDAILFTGYCPHGTLVDRDMTEARLSCELKLFPNTGDFHENFLRNLESKPNHAVFHKRVTVGPVGVMGFTGPSKWSGPTHNYFAGEAPQGFEFRYGCLPGGPIMTSLLMPKFETRNWTASRSIWPPARTMPTGS